MINIHWWPNVKHMSLNLAFLGSQQMILAIVVKLLHTYYVQQSTILIYYVQSVLFFNSIWYGNFFVVHFFKLTIFMPKEASLDSISIFLGSSKKKKKTTQE